LKKLRTYKSISEFPGRTSMIPQGGWRKNRKGKKKGVREERYEGRSEE